MRRSTVVACGVILAACVLAAGLSVYAQVARPYRNGSVWEMSLIRMKPGMETAYLNYIATDWKKVQESAKKEGLILSYRVLTTEGHDQTDWNIVLMTEYKDLATMEANERKSDAFSRRPSGMTRSRCRATRIVWRSAMSWARASPGRSFWSRRPQARADS